MRLGAKLGQRSKKRRRGWQRKRRFALRWRQRSGHFII